MLSAFRAFHVRLQWEGSRGAIHMDEKRIEKLIDKLKAEDYQP